MINSIPVPMEIRLFFFQTAALVTFTGWLWMRGYPRYGSVWGFKFKDAMASEACWKELHRKIGKLFVGLGIWIAIPFPTLTGILYFQMPVILFAAPIGVMLIKRSVK